MELSTGPKNAEPSVARTFRLTKTSDGHLAYVLVTAARLKRLATELGIDIWDEARLLDLFAGNGV